LFHPGFPGVIAAFRGGFSEVLLVSPEFRRLVEDIAAIVGPAMTEYKTGHPGDKQQSLPNHAPPKLESKLESGTGLRDLVFISYSHSNAYWLERLLRMLNPIVSRNNIFVWDDSRILAGTNRRQET
jgi:hypothetical protein